MKLNKDFWKGRKVFLTGHTGFKGGWLSVFLNYLGANALGYSLKAEQKSFFNQVGVDSLVNHQEQDIRDLESLKKLERDFEPEILVHMAAQPLVIESYKDPLTTFTTNTLGTVNILELIRESPSIKSAVIITTDKCYENKNLYRGYREDDPMGGHDPYSSSKGSAEVIISSYQRSFFDVENYKQGSASIASVRAGNVIGGGDWAVDRLIPDLVRSVDSSYEVKIRNPKATRPWQHVLEPLMGYLMVAEKLFNEGPSGSDSWNFGPYYHDIKSVSSVADLFCKAWGDRLSWSEEPQSKFYEAQNLSLDIGKAEKTLGWRPKWTLSEAIDRTVEWYKVEKSGKSCLDISIQQIDSFLDE